MRQQVVFTVLCLVIGHYGVNSISEMLQISSWTELDFAFPTPNERNYAISKGLYIRGNGVPIDVDVDYGRVNRRIFVTVPRFTTGIPFSLGVVSDFPGNGGPLLTAYPSYDWHSSHGKNCDGITSVFRVAIDECQKLWVLDTGRIDATQYCPPQLLVFDLKTDRLFHRYRFPQGQYIPGKSLFVTPIVDVRDPPSKGGNCLNAQVYIADVTGFGIIVYSSKLNKSWRVQHDLTKPNLQYADFTIAGQTFNLPDGILGMSVSPKNAPTRYLYFHALASLNENRVPLSVLDDYSIWLNNPNGASQAFSIIGYRKYQSAAEAMDKNGNLFFGLMNPISIAAWNTYRLDNIRIVAQNDERLQFASGVKVITNPKTNLEELWVLTCRFQKIMTGTKNSNEINFRVQGCLVDNLLSGSKCT